MHKVDRTSSLRHEPSGASSTVEQQVSQLRQQFAKLEAETGTRHEAAQQSIKQNRQIWLQLKQQNKDLKAELSKRSTPASRDAGKSVVDRTIEKLEKEVHELRRQYDKIMQEKKTAVSKLENLQDSVKELSKPSTSGRAGSASSGNAAASKEGREVRMLENRLDKAQMKCNEAQSIRRTYEQVLEKMKKEAQGFDPHIKALEEAVVAKVSEKDGVLLAHREAIHAKEVAKQELAAGEAKVAAARAHRDATLAKQRTTVQTLGEANRALLARQFGPGAAPGTSLQGTGMQGLSLAGAGPGADGGSSSTANGGQNSASQPALAPVQTVEEAVKKLCEVTATASVSAMLDRLLPQHGTFKNLSEMKASATKQVEVLRSEVAEARQQLEDLQTGGKGTTQIQLDVMQAKLADAKHAADAAQEQYNQVLQVYVGVRSGLEHLSAMLAPLPLPPGQLPVPLSDDTLGDVLAQCQLRLTSAIAFIHTLPKAASLLDGIMQNPDFNFTAKQ